MAVCSPGELNPRWIVVFVTRDGQPFSVVRVMDAFNPELIKPCILAGAPDGGIVFDPFVGSGTTVATAIQLGRKEIGIDLSFKYLQENAKVRVDESRLPLLDFAEVVNVQRA